MTTRDIYEQMADLPRTDEPVGGIIAKFYVTGIQLQPYGATIDMSAVSRGARNASWSEATPSGSIKMFVSNKAAVTQFLRALAHTGGPEFMVRFEHAPVKNPGDGHEFIPSPDNHYNKGRCAECAEPEDQHHPADGPEPDNAPR